MELARLLIQVNAALGQAGFEIEPVPAEFATREGKADLKLLSRSWRGPAGTEAKCAYLSGPRAEICNLMIYPCNNVEVPVFAVELILFGQQPRVAVVDLQPAAGAAASPPLMARLAEELAPLHQTFQGRFSPGGELPEWATAHFTPWAIYSRPQSMAELPGLLAACQSYLQVWLNRFYPAEQGPSQGMDWLRRYQSHHVENSPGRRFLVTSFGSEWTENYLARFMYPCWERAL